MCARSATKSNVHTRALMRFKNNGDYLHYSLGINQRALWVSAFSFCVQRFPIRMHASFCHACVHTNTQARGKITRGKTIGSGRKLIIRSSIIIYAPCRILRLYLYFRGQLAIPLAVLCWMQRSSLHSRLASELTSSSERGISPRLVKWIYLRSRGNTDDKEKRKSAVCLIINDRDKSNFILISFSREIHEFYQRVNNREKKTFLIDTIYL